jgi:hypothetical protein
MIKIIRVSVIFASFSISTHALADDPGGDFSVQLFLKTCVTSFAYAPKVALEAQAMGLDELTGNKADKYLGGQHGRVWYVENNSGAFALTLLRAGLCTVIVHDGDGERIRAGFESWLPPSDSGITVKTEDISSQPGLTSTSYTIHGGKINEMWTLSVSSIPESRIRAIMSYEGHYFAPKARHDLSMGSDSI